MDTRDSALLASLFSLAVGLAFWGGLACVLILVTNTPADWADWIRGWINARA